MSNARLDRSPSTPPTRAQAHPHRIRAARRTLGLFALTAAIACDRSDGSVTIRGDVEGLDSISRRADSLVARATGASSYDSLQRLLGFDAMARASVDSAMLAASVLDFATAADSSTLARVDAASRVSPRSRLDSAARRSLADSIAEAMRATRALSSNPMSRRAQARGDSMARAAAQRFISGASNARSHGDTIRGVVTLVGAGAIRQPMLRVNGNVMITLSGMGSRGLSRLEGAEVVARGVRVSPRDIVLTDYVVRTMRGQQVWDGKLSGPEDGWTLVLTDGSGSRPLPVLPSALEGLGGVRVWMAYRDGSQAPMAYGIIQQY